MDIMIDKPSTRLGATSWHDDKYAYIFGGYIQSMRVDSKPFNDLWRFDGEKWEEIIVAGAKPSVRYNAVSWHDGKRYAYVWGGCASAAFNDLWRFDGVMWEEVIIKGDKPPAMYCILRWYDGTHAYICGGINDIWRYDGVKWEQIK